MTTSPTLKLSKMSVLFATMAGVAIPSFQAAAAPEQEKVSITENEPPLSPTHAARLSDLTIHALKLVEDSEHALSTAKPSVAKDDLTKANYVLETVRAELPTVIIRDSLWKSAKKAQSGKAVDIQPELMPVYDQLDAMQEFAPAKAAKSHVAKAAEHAKAGRNMAAAGELHDAMNVLENDEVDVRLDKMQQTINSSIKLIEAGKPKEALAELNKGSFLEVFDTTLFGIPVVNRLGH